MRFILILTLLALCLCNEKDQRYHPGDKFYAWTNRIGPYHNPHETYDYFSLPFCRPALPDKFKTKKGGISEVLEGTSLQNSGIEFSFMNNAENVMLCEMKLDEEQALKLQKAIFNHYWYQLEIDGLPIWAKVGDLDMAEEEIEAMEKKGSHHEVIPGKARMYTHRLFTIDYNEDRIVKVDMTSSNLKVVEKDTPIVLTTSVVFTRSDTPFEKRFDRYLEFNYFESQVHWFSIVNSFMIVIFLAGLVALIMMRTLNMDYIRYAQDYNEESLEMAVREETGWKRVHGDVFRPCEHLTLYSVLMGNGAHLAFTVILSILVILLATSYVGHDRVLSIVIGVYVLGFLLNGFVSGSIYKQAFFPRTSPQWQRAMIVSCGGLPAIIAIGYTLLCLMSMSYGSLTSFPFRNLFIVVLFWLVICLPLHTLGTILGRSLKGNPNYPCRVASLPSPIAPSAFYAKPSFIIGVSGLLPFGAVFIEIFFIFASIWSYKYYYVYGFLASVVVILIIIQVCVSIVGTYVLLNAENYKWRWTSFLSGCSIGIYIFVYCIYFYVNKTEMNGVIQAVYFFAESILLVVAIALFCGFISSYAAEVFVKRIFKNIKVD